MRCSTTKYGCKVQVFIYILLAMVYILSLSIEIQIKCILEFVCLNMYMCLSSCYFPELPSTTQPPAVTISVWRLWLLVAPPSTPLTSGGALRCTMPLPRTWTGGEAAGRRVYSRSLVVSKVKSSFEIHLLTRRRGGKSKTSSHHTTKCCTGWLSTVSTYRNLMVHTFPVSMVTMEVILRWR